jgi:RimJ/RimL family protein N-acetyltransferase
MYNLLLSVVLPTIMTSSVPLSRVPDTYIDRLRLREFELKDAADIFQLNSNPKMAEFQSWEPLKDEGQAVRWVERAQSETPRTSFTLVVTSREGGTFIGNIGAEVDSESFTIEIWYSIAPEFHGRGYATEAVRALISLQVLPRKHKLEIECAPRNTPSRKLAERIGFQQVFYPEQATEIAKGQWVGVVRYVMEQQDLS